VVASPGLIGVYWFKYPDQPVTGRASSNTRGTILSAAEIPGL